MYSGVNDPSDSVRYNFQDDRTINTTNHVPFLKSIFKGKRYWVRGDQEQLSSSSHHHHRHQPISGRRHHHHHYDVIGAHCSSPTISASTTATNLSSEDIMTPQTTTTTTGGSHLGSNLGHGADIEPLNPSRKDLRQDSPSVEKELIGTRTVRKSCTFEQVLTAISVSLVSLVIGFVSAYTAPAAESLKQDLNITEFQYSWVCGLMPLSALVGGLTGGQLIDYFGRKKTIGVTNVLYLFAWALCACAPDIWWVYGSRCIIGFGVGIASLALPVYLGETIQPEVRGTLGLLPAAFGNTGILVCFVAGSYVNWQSLAWVGFAFSVPFLGLMFFIQESPRWYVTKHRDDEAMAALRWLRGGKEANITAEFQDLINSQKESSQTTTAITDLLTKAYMRPLLISLGLMFFQQLSGINAVIFYTTTIFKMAGNTNDMYMCTIIVGVVNFISTFIATLLIDKLGRKVLLYISSIAMVLTLAVLGTYFYLVKIEVDVSAFGWLPLASFVVYVLGFSLGFGPIPWLMMGEILPSKIRGTAASLATAFNWSCTFIVTKTFVDIIALIGPHGTFWLFGGFCVFAVMFVCACVPETQGKSLEDIERKFAGESVRRVSSIANFKPSPFGS